MRFSLKLNQWPTSDWSISYFSFDFSLKTNEKSLIDQSEMGQWFNFSENLNDSDLESIFLPLAKGLRNIWILPAYTLHSEIRYVKFRRSSVFIFTTCLLSRFYNKLSLINRFSLHSTCLPVKSTNLGLFLFCRFYWTLSEMYRKSVAWNKLLVKSTKKSSCKSNYWTFCKLYEFFSACCVFLKW